MATKKDKATVELLNSEQQVQLSEIPDSGMALSEEKVTFIESLQGLPNVVAVPPDDEAEHMAAMAAYAEKMASTPTIPASELGTWPSKRFDKVDAFTESINNEFGEGETRRSLLGEVVIYHHPGDGGSIVACDVPAIAVELMSDVGAVTLRCFCPWGDETVGVAYEGENAGCWSRRE